MYRVEPSVSISPYSSIWDLIGEEDRVAFSNDS